MVARFVTLVAFVAPPAEVSACVGDCNGDGEVTIEEILTGVSIALGADSKACPAFDRDQNGTVTIEEILAGVLSALQGCPADLPPTFSALQAQIFSPRCAFSGCHSARDRVANLDLESDSAYSSLVHAPPENFAAALRGLVRVRPSSLEQSLLWLKVQPTVSPEYGSRMPVGGPALTDSERQMLASWILGGAPP
jgi:hypothetical protein